MGTNYYIHYNKKKYHIGKKSGGWNFIFNWLSIIDLALDSNIINVYDWSLMVDELRPLFGKPETITISFTMIKSIIYTHKDSIYNECDDLIDFGDFWDMAVSLNRDCKSETTSINIDGYYGTNYNFS